MKKLWSQLTVALVCALLGFMLTYQFKLLNAKENLVSKKTTNSNEINAEVEQIKKLNSELQKKNTELMEQLKTYEKNAADKDETAKEMAKQLDTMRTIMGYTKVEGTGVVITITPKEAVFSNNATIAGVDYKDLVFLVDELIFAGAEAISINDQRITSQTGIRVASENSYILINDDKISATEKITVKAIGNQSELKSELGFPTVLDNKFQNSVLDIQPADLVEIPAYNKAYTSKYIKPVK